MTSETYLDLTFERTTKSSSAGGGGAGGGGGGGSVNISLSSNATTIGSGSGGIATISMTASEKRPIRPKLLKLSDVTIPHRNRKKTKTKSKDRSMSSVRDRIYDDPAYTDDISHLANPIRRSSVNLVNTDNLTVSSAKATAGGSSSLGKRSKLTKEFQKLAQEDIGHIAFSSSEEDLRYQRASSARSEVVGRGRSLERANAIMVAEQSEKLELKRRNEKRSNKQKRNLSLDNKRQQDSKEAEEKERDRPPEPPQRLALTRYNLGKQRSDEAAWQRQQSQMEFAAAAGQENEDVFSMHSSAKETLSVAASTTASISNASTSKMQMGKRFLKGEIGIKSFNYYLLKEGLKSSKKFVEKQKNNFQTSNAASNQNPLLTAVTSSASAELLSKSKLQANSEENIYEEIFFKDTTPASEEDDENQNKNLPASAAAVNDQNIVYADCELCMQRCDKPDCEYCLQPELSANVNQNRTTTQAFNTNTNSNSNNKTANTTTTGNRLMASNLNNNASARTAMENQVNQAPILEFQSYNPNNPGVYKIETTPVAITGDYNPILQFQQPSTQPQQQQQQQQQQHTIQHQQQQHHAHMPHHQSTSNTSTATTTPSDHNLHPHHSQTQSHPQQQQQQQHLQQHSQPAAAAAVQQPQQFYGYKQPNFYTPQIQPGFWSQTSSATRPTRAYMVTGHFPGGVSSMQRMNTKSSSSSDSLQQQKFNTFTHLDANFYNGAHVANTTGSSAINNSYLPPQPLQPLMYAASRRLGGSQILVDTNTNNMFENPPQIYKSDSRASILSEYSLSRSSDTYYGVGPRYGHNRSYGTSHHNDQHTFENSLMASYATANQRRYFGSAESCRFGYDCRRCSLDSGPGAGLLGNHRASNAAQPSNGTNPPNANEKCTFSDHCKYDCRNCDCSSVYFSSDFDEIYSGGGIPRKTAKGTLPSTGGQPPPPALDNYDMATTNSEKQQALKQNKYAQDFFKHVNDVKRSIYQAEMQRNGNMESLSPKKSVKKESREKERDKERDRERDREVISITTLPLAKERSPKPTPAPRTSLQQQPQALATPQPLQRRLPIKTIEQPTERKEYASLDRLIASNKGAIPKSSNTQQRISPHSSPKTRASAVETKTKEQFLTLDAVSHEHEKRHTKKHSKESSKISSATLSASLSAHRRKDVPAPPPPSPATYADLQELQLNMQDTMRDDTKQERKRKRKQHDEGNEHEKQQELATTTAPQTKDEREQQQHQEQQQLTETETVLTTTTTKEGKTMDAHKAAVNNAPEEGGKLTTIEATHNSDTATCHIVTTNNASMPHAPDAIGNVTNTIATQQQTEEETQSVTLNNEDALKKSHALDKVETATETVVSTPCSTAQTQTSFSSMTLVSITSVSSSIVTAQDSQQRDQLEIYDDDVFYDARSEDSACTAATSSSMASKSEQKLEQQHQQPPPPQPVVQQQEQHQQQQSNKKSCAETKCKQSEREVKEHEYEQEQGHAGVTKATEELRNLENPETIHQQDKTSEGKQQQPEHKNLENEGQNQENQQQQKQQQQQHQQTQQPTQTMCHKINEPLQLEQQMNKNEVKKRNSNCDNNTYSNSNSNNNPNKDNDDVKQDDDNDKATKENIKRLTETTDSNTNTTTTNITTITTRDNTETVVATSNKTSTTTATTATATAELKEVSAAAAAATVTATATLELKVNKTNKKKQEINENANNNKKETATATTPTQNNNEGNFITKDNEKSYKTDKRETKRTSKSKRDYLHEEERREIRLKQQQHQLDDEKPTTTVITSKTSTTSGNTNTGSLSLTKKQRSQRRSPSSSSDYNRSREQHKQQQQQQLQQQQQQQFHKLPISTLSCDTCCQLEWSQQQNYTKSHTQQQSPQTLKPPTLHIGMAGQPARVSKRKNSSSSSASRERATKTKQQEIKTKIVYTHAYTEKPDKPERLEKIESNSNCNTTTTTTTAGAGTNGGGASVLTSKSTWRETGLSTTKINKTKDMQEQPQTCSLTVTTTNVAESKVVVVDAVDKMDEQSVKEELKTENNTQEQKQQPDILKEIKEISQAIASLQHEAESSDTVTLENEPSNKAQHVAATKHGKQEMESTKIKTQTDNTTNVAAANNNKEHVIIAIKEQQTKENVADDNDAATAANTTTAANDGVGDGDGDAVNDAETTATANDSKTNTTNISCNSEFAGVTTHSPHNSPSPIVPLITTLQSSLSLESETRRPPLQRQDYSCLDSSEAQSDDSHLTRDSITRESQNDELSSSTLDKIDVSTLPLPALPPKKRRTKLRASPSKHHRSRHESPQKSHQQPELRDPHGAGDSNQLTVEDTKHLSAFQQYVAKRRESLEASTRSFNEKLESRRMHYHMGGGGGGGGGGGVPTVNSATNAGAGLHMPTYLFGEQYYAGLPPGANRKSMGPGSKEEIYLNKSGWVQVNTKRANDENRGYRRANYNHQNGDLRNAIRVIQIDNTRRSDMARQALLQHQHSMMEAPKFVSSKVEELIQRNEARLGNANTRDSALRPGYRIVDPHLASILNERPGFLPVKNLNDHDSPPPITPILSPPPAFQDSSAKIKCFDHRRTISSRPTTQLTGLQPQTIITNTNLQATNGGVNNKGMVFSRSFEYDNRRPTPTDAYVETFSRSFDGNLTERVPSAPLPRDRSPNFSTLTGNSPNYLTKKDSGGGSSGSLKSRDSSPKYQSPVASISSAQSPQNQKTTAYLNTSVKEAPPSYSVASSLNAQKYSPRSAHHERSFERSKSHNVLGRSRKSQFNRSGSGSTAVMANSMGVSRFRSFDTTTSQRLNSCDSGARSDLSNDELDIEEDDNGSSEFLNTNSYHPATSPFKTQRQRSLTPDRNESHSSSSSLRKQRSITPESRSLTPEDRRKKGSQVSLSGSRQNSSSRSNTLERKHEKVNISRSSSSSSYSGREHDGHVVGSGVGGGGSGGGGLVVMEERAVRVGLGGMNVSASQHRRSLGRNAKQADEHRIRRSRSLQLTERSPNRGHKMVVCVGQNHANVVNQPPLYQQANMRTNNFPPTIRASSKSQSILINNINGGVASTGARQRQSDIDKSRSFDFDYCNYNASTANLKAPHHSNSSLLSTQNLLNREAALRLDFDKSRSFDEDYREGGVVVSNNNLNANAMRYLQASDGGDRNHATRIRRTSPVEGNGRNTRSPQSSGSSCNNLNVPRSNTSPQNYGTRLCDHEMTYDLMRKSLDRSPIMDFRRGDSAGAAGDYDMPVMMLRNRETINSGGNSELNFMNADTRQYEHSMATNSLKHQRSLRRTHSPNESHYSLERGHSKGSRDDVTPPEPNDYRNDYNDLYRRTRSNNRGSDLSKTKTTTTTTTLNLPNNTATTTNNNLSLTTTNTLQQCSYWPQCGACQNSMQSPDYEYLKSLPLKRQPTQLKQLTAPASVAVAFPNENNTSITPVKANISTVKINMKTNLQQQHQQQTLPKSTTQWTLLCKNALAPAQTNIKATTPSLETTSNTLLSNTNTNTNTNINIIKPSNTVVNVNTTTATATATVTIAPSNSASVLMTTKSTETSTLTSDSSAVTTTSCCSSALVTCLQPSARVIPLAATSLVLLGDFEMPITRERQDNHIKPLEEENKCNKYEIYERQIHDNLKKLYTNTTNATTTTTPATTAATTSATINEKQTRRKFATNKNKNFHKTSKMLTMKQILENDDGDNHNENCDGDSSSSSSSSSGSHKSTSLTSISCASGNNSHNVCSTSSVTTISFNTVKHSKNSSSRAQKYCRHPRLSLPNIWLNAAAAIDANIQQKDDSSYDKIRQERYTRTTTTSAAANNEGGINSVIGIRNGFPINLSQQIRAVSSPSLTTDNNGSVIAATNDNNNLVHQRVPSSNSSYITASHEDCQTATTTTAAAITSNASNTASQNVGVLQKFKRTLTNFNNKHQQPVATNQMAVTTTTTAATSTDSSAFPMAEGEMQTDITDGCSSSGAGTSVVSNKYRFGPLVWRTSKERRKTKYNRRDKCNSGDSGIQIELENDEQFARVLAANGNGGNVMNVTAATASTGGGSLFNRKQEGMNSLRVRSVRRTNSAKVSTIIDENPSTTVQTTTKANILKRIDMHNEREAPESLPTRSLSQPNGLESCGMTRNDLDDSDSDSVTSHEDASNYYPIYAEVLYNFTAAGPQELGLEKGTLIEILRKEIGPWWFGRIKKEDASLVEEILDPELGWFPKEFVRVIHTPETDFFYLQHMAEQQQHEQQQQHQQLQHHHHQQQQQQQQPNDTTHLSHHELTENNSQIGNQTMSTSSSAPCALVNCSTNSTSTGNSNCIGDDNCNTTVIDQHNVTTIVIESSSSTSPPSSTAITANHFVDIESCSKASNDVTSSTCLTVHHTTTTSGSVGQATILSTSQSLNVIMDSADILRRSAVKELLDTEVNYVKLLTSICEGYLPAMSKRIDIFSPNSIRLIFSNITAIYKFQRRFLDALRKGIEQNQVAKVFLKMHKGFLCYSTYCNSYPRALIELASYERVKDARTILDNCRESENLAELPLSAHLLAPVQRICRYPLHLGEMIKSSAKGMEPPAFSLQEFEQIDVSQLDIPDTTETIDMALEAMKSITEAVNEGKRHSETIARHQASFQNFKGPPLHLHSTRFFLQIDATRQKQNLWNSSCTLFLFDNQLVYCKRDIIKRSNFIYKGRIFLDRCRVVNVRDGKMFGHTIKNSLRIYCEARDKWFDFSFRSANRKHRFLNTLALERQFGGKSLYISEMTGFEYAFEERDYSDQSDYEGGDSGEQKLKEFLYETNINTGNNTNTSGESSVPESPAKTFKYSDTLPHKKSQRLDTAPNTQTNDNQTGSLGRRRLGNWFRKPKSSASTPNQSPTHKPTQSAHSTGDLQLTGTDTTETYTVLEHNENGGGVSS